MMCAVLLSFEGSYMLVIIYFFCDAFVKFIYSLILGFSWHVRWKRFIQFFCGDVGVMRKVSFHWV